MNCIPSSIANPVERFVAQFPSVVAAAAAADVTTEMLRKMRRRGFVTTRDRALVMAQAVGNKITAAELLAVATKGRAS